jgi:hypothetical protein
MLHIAVVMGRLNELYSRDALIGAMVRLQPPLRASRSAGRKWRRNPLESPETRIEMADLAATPSKALWLARSRLYETRMSRVSSNGIS